MIVLDTNVVSEILRPSPERAVQAWVDTRTEMLTLTSITSGELLFGVRRLPAGRRRDDLISGVEDILAAFAGQILHYDAIASRTYAELKVRREAQGRSLSTEDGMIAAICLNLGAELATRNTKNFVGLGVTLVNPWNEV